MGDLNKFLAENFSLIAFLVLVWLAALTYLLLAIKNHYNRLTQDTQAQSLTKILDQISKKLERSDKSFTEINKAIEKINEKGKKNFCKRALVRFNPFADAGGDQSFVVALLDENDDGVVIASLHSRDFSKVYAKPVQNGQPVKYQFSKEEEEAVKIAQRK